MSINSYYFWCIIILYSATVFCAAQKLPDLKECVSTFKMLDASGKIPSGILSGNIIEIGAYDQCLGVKEQSSSGAIVNGKYCMVKLQLPLDKLMKKATEQEGHNRHRQKRAAIIQTPSDPSPGLLLGWCIPDHCLINNVTNIISPVLNFANVSVSPIFGSGLCQTQNDLNEQLTGSDWGALGFLIFIGAIMVISTIYDIYLHYTKKKSAHIVFTAFSIKMNGQKLLAISNNPNQISCLHGIRFISMMWVIYGHGVSNTFTSAIVNPLVNTEWKNKAVNMYLLNAPVSVDTFFVLSGLLVAYGFLLAKDKGFNFNILVYYLHRYIRLTPALGAVLLVHATFLNHFSSGPFWPLIPASLQNTCKDYWWTTLLYIQNYYNADKMCIGQSWYLSVDTQLFVLSPLILLPLWRWPKYTMIGSALLLIASMIISFVITYQFDLGAFVSSTNPDYMTVYYFATHNRFGPWVMGIILGYYIFRIRKRQPDYFTLHPAQVCFGWLLSLALLFSTLFAGHDLLLKPDRLSDAFFSALHRHGWSLGICIVIYLCTEGYGGPVNAFLSWSVFQILGRFTYTMYLTHFSIQYIILGSARTSTYFSDFNNAYRFWGDFAITLFVAICLTLSFESPMLTLEKLIFKTGPKKKPEQLPVYHKENGNSNSSGEHTNGGYEKAE